MSRSRDSLASVSEKSTLTCVNDCLSHAYIVHRPQLTASDASCLSPLESLMYRGRLLILTCISCPLRRRQVQRLSLNLKEIRTLVIN